MDFQPEEFANVPYGSIIAAACAPRIDDSRFRGIVIRVPSGVRLASGEHLVLPICGYYQLPTLPLLNGADMEIHVRGVKSTPYPPVSAPIVIVDGPDEPDVTPPWADQPLNPKLYEGKVSEAYFYLDAQRYLPAPLAPGEYEISVSYGRDRSNSVVTQITVR